MSPNAPASIKARLLKKAHDKGEQLELFLVRYACERFLYRLGASPLRERCILKGATLLSLWMEDPYRATRDIDLMSYGPNTDVGIRAAMAAIVAVSCPEDGLRFDIDSLEISPIRGGEEYGGQRAVLLAFLGKARIRIQIDFGFGDAIVPSPEDVEYPGMLRDLPAPRLKVYPRVVAIAEKFNAMVELGLRNSRMKDFHDVWTLSSAFAFDGSALRDAVFACFERRRTAWTAETPDPLGAPFYSNRDLQTRWSAYLRSGAFRQAPPQDFTLIGARIRGFLGPIRESIAGQRPFGENWPPGGPWE